MRNQTDLLFSENAFQCPDVNWQEVISCLDHPDFLISTVEGLRLIVTACQKGTQDIFPIEYLYRPWTNSKGQVEELGWSIMKGDRG